ncbi:beta-N-acetylhexosaminidase [Paenibacillus sp. UNCCL117]|uniref:beta-N-acetylhexosaminidase n=1 Tax=unclassified Paenibacillus TaxID=185978 RepID=UPI000885B7DF|nr:MULTISPECIES: beta-N-acetylhexosaminidase [unclassified Paenibacillus]SDD13529.1 beta-N-acetylhexosaminidase [Paenibacillus sp. cl123]SFW34008.1 beta-N-acetylhexosaminidase [Paenibacillus sp. UNCCL117]
MIKRIQQRSAAPGSIAGFPAYSPPPAERSLRPILAPLMLMMCFLSLGLLAGCSLGGQHGAPPQTDTTGQAGGPSGTAPEAPSPAPDPVQEVIDGMTTEEKIGQLVLIGLDGLQLDDRAEAFIRERHIGSVILYKRNISSLAQTVSLVQALKTAGREQPLPLWISIDQEGGAVSRLPAEFAPLPDSARIGAAHDAQLARSVGELLGEELRLAGMNMDFAPVLDVNNNPANPVIGPRSYGADAQLVAELGAQAMAGIASQGVVPVVKHFPGHGDTDTDSHLKLPVVRKSLEELRRLELIPFKRAIAEGADAVMVAHLLLPELDASLPSSLSPTIVNGLLREELGFRGVVMTDDLTMGAISGSRGIGEAAAAAVRAGADIVMIAHGYDQANEAINALRLEAASGRLTPERLNASVYRIAALKCKYDLPDRGQDMPSIKQINERIRRLEQDYPALKPSPAK